MNAWKNKSLTIFIFVAVDICCNYSIYLFVKKVYDLVIPLDFVIVLRHVSFVFCAHLLTPTQSGTVAFLHPSKIIE